MKICSLPIITAIALGIYSTKAHGTFQYDQQSVLADSISGSFLVIQTNSPIGQSFVPSLSSVGFIRLSLDDVNKGNNLGATMYINLREGSITGPIIGSTQPVFMPDSFENPTNFFFSTPVAVTPGTTYYFEPVVQSGDLWYTVAYNYQYPNGSAYTHGSPISWDLWFREGVVVPEPSSALLLSIGAGALVYVHRKLTGMRRL
jgi:hypothetical protein